MAKCHLWVYNAEIFFVASGHPFAPVIRPTKQNSKKVFFGTPIGDRQMHGNHKSARHRTLVAQAEAKQRYILPQPVSPDPQLLCISREAMLKDKEAEALESQAVETERNVHRLCDALLFNGRQR